MTSFLPSLSSLQPLPCDSPYTFQMQGLCVKSNQNLIFPPELSPLLISKEPNFLFLEQVSTGFM